MTDRRVDATAFGTREELRAGMRRVREGAYRPGRDQLTLDDIARDAKALAKADRASFLPAPKTTVAGWLKPNGPLPRTTETRPFRAFLRACGVPPGELQEWVDALGRVQDTAAAESPVPEPVVEPSVPEPGPEPPADPPRPATPGDTLGPPALPGVRLALGIAATALGVLAAIAAVTTGQADGAPWPPVLGVGVALLLLAPWLRARLRYDPGVDLDDALAGWATDLRGRWGTELEGRRWVEPRLRVGWHVDVPDEPEWARQVADARGPGPGPGWPRPERIDGHDDELADALSSRLPTRRLLLVGGSGAGKSVLLLHLAVRLSREAARRGDVPYPALVSLASWDRADDLEVWLARRLALEDPRLGRRARGHRCSVAAVALRAGRLIPVLDGLDEIGDPAERVDALARIDGWLRRAERPGLVVATRPMPEGAVLTPPRLTPVAHVDPLPTTDARAYLAEHAGGAVWDEVLPDDPTDPVTRAMRRPLAVWLAATVYQALRPGPRPDPRDLRSLPDERAVVRHLIGLFLPAAYEDPPRPGWTPARAERWLATVAAFTGGPDLRWWELWRRARRPVLALLALPGALAVGLVAGFDHRLGMGLGCGILAGIGAAVAVRRLRHAVPGVGDFGPGITVGFVGALAGAVLGGLLALRTGLDDTPWRGVVGALGAGIAAGGVARYRPAALVGGLVGGLVVPLTANAGVGLVAGVLDGLGAWVAGAMVIGGTRGLPARRLSRPNVLVALGVAVPCGLAIGARAAAVHGPVTGIVAGVLVGVLGGVAAGATAAPMQVSGFSADPRDVLEADRRTFWTMLPLGGLAFAAGAAVTVNPWVGAAAFVIVGLGSAATRTAWPAFVVARCWFAARRRLPLPLMAFLDDAHAKGVLRQNGAGYQIRHLELAEYLRDQGSGTSTVK